MFSDNFFEEIPKFHFIFGGKNILFNLNMLVLQDRICAIWGSRGEQMRRDFRSDIFMQL